MVGEPNFLNRTLWIEDNLKVLRGINSECVDLIYLDPPFNTKRIYNAPLGSKAAGAKFDDTWTMDGVKSEWAELQEHADPAMYHTVVGAGLAADESMQAYLSFMALRMVEMHRVLKPTGSLYLHCDPTASHYLKQLLDCIFGRHQFRNEITWRSTSAHSDARRFGANTETILFYTSGTEWTWNQIYTPYEESYRARYRQRDEDGRAWVDDNLTAKGLTGGGYEYEYKGAESLWRVPLETMERLDAENRLHFTRNGGIRRKRYLDEMPGRPVQQLWQDINPVNSQAKERTGWPTQKPLALLERVITASSNPGDMVLDPFAGCATTCVAAELLGRQWAGIDIDSKALDVTVDRLQRQTDERNRNVKDNMGTDQLPGLARDETSGTWTTPEIIAADTPPKRTDPDAPTRSPRIRAIRWAELGDGDRRPCPGCGRDKFIDDFDLDHIVPRSKGGLDTDDNLQLLCSPCNRLKGARTMNELKRLLGTT